MNKHYDIIIGGGGMIGTSLALALRPLNLKIAMVEPVPRSSASQPSFDDRSTALSRSTQRMMEAMGIWPDVKAASTPITSIHVSDKGRFGFSHIDAEEQGVEALGYVVINRVLGNVLQQQADQSLDLYCPQKIDRLTIQEEVAHIVLSDGKTELTADLLVAADGARSLLREQMDIGVDVKDYRQTAIIGNLETELPIRNRAYERFTPDGPVAFLPITDDRAAFIWILDTDLAQEKVALPDDEFLEALQSAFGQRLGRFSRVGERVAYPLSLSKANRLVSTRSVLVGNSAHGLHPVAAQGFNLGMRDVAALCDCVADAQKDEQPLGSDSVLQRYAEWRKQDQGRLVQITDGIVELFASERHSTRLARSLGMLGFDLVPGVRSLFAKQMMGLNGRLPRLSRGVPLQ